MLPYGEYNNVSGFENKLHHAHLGIHCGMHRVMKEDELRVMKEDDKRRIKEDDLNTQSRLICIFVRIQFSSDVSLGSAYFRTSFFPQEYTKEFPKMYKGNIFPDVF